MMEDFKHVVRVVVVPDQWNVDGVKEFWADRWVLAIADDGLTLKLFGTGKGEDAKAKRDAAMAGDFSQIEDHRWWHWHRKSKNGG
jgi:hypothetical protein